MQPDLFYEQGHALRLGFDPLGLFWRAPHLRKIAGTSTSSASFRFFDETPKTF
jgi:hypothetical protein